MDHNRTTPSLTKLARERRKNPTYTEKLLWRVLRSRRVEGIKFRREVPIEGYIADFFCFEHKLIIEVDGDVHDKVDVKQHDEIRQVHLESQGYKVIRFSADDVFGRVDWVVDEILKHCV
ncbi:MAG TPA: endonuclease domain-containing protein [Candidatus Kapabacteria bacterium]|nr:endonuclease domain-containing protein [Candidatus Kapabacteria bacterium]